MDPAILLIDKSGFLANPLLKKLVIVSPSCKTVLISQINFSGVSEKVNYIYYGKRIPLIPRDQYSAIVVVFSGEKEILEALPEFIKEAKRTKGKLFLVASRHLAKENFIEKIVKENTEAKAIFLGDIFGINNFDKSTTIDRFLQQARIGGKIKIKDGGLGKIYPVYFDDVLNEIIKIVLNPNNNTPSYLFTKHGVSVLSLSRMLKKINPSLRIDFYSENKNEKNNDIVYQGDFILGEDYKIEEKLKEAFNSKDEDENKENINKMESPKKSKNFFKPFLLLVFLMAFFAMLMPFFSTLLLSFFGAYELKAAKKMLENGNFSQAKKDIVLAKELFDLGVESGKILHTEASFIGKGEDSQKLIENIIFGKEVSMTAIKMLDAVEGYAKVFSGKSSNPNEDFTNASNLLKSSIVAFQKFQAEGDKNLLLELDQKNIDKVINVSSSMVDVLPQVLGFDGEKKYLVLFQNNMELRPGGGFIGSYGIIKINKGKIIDFSIHDVYDADGQLKGHVEPPFALRRNMGVVHLFLRDSNFDVDFTTNAKNASFLLNKETGDVVDGVIGIDVSFVKNLVEILGPFNVADYNEIISGKNFYMITQSKVEKNSFEGSSQKKDFLRSLYSSILLNLSSRKELPYLSLAEAIVTSISQKHVLFAFSDPSLQQVFTINKMSSALWDNREESESTINDFLGINEANIGINKTNYFINRKINQEVNIDEKGNISEKVTIYYKNDSVDWPGGEYRNYLRLILPFGSNLSSISVDDVTQDIIPAITDFQIYEAKNFKQPKGLEVEKTEDKEKVIYGFLVSVPQGSFKKISISYTLPQRISLDLPTSFYNNRVFKQPGTDKDQYQFSLSYPNNWQAFALEKDFNNQGKKIELTTKLSQDLDFSINLGRK